MKWRHFRTPNELTRISRRKLVFPKSPRICVSLDLSPPALWWMTLVIRPWVSRNLRFSVRSIHHPDGIRTALNMATRPCVIQKKHRGIGYYHRHDIRTVFDMTIQWANEDQLASYLWTHNNVWIHNYSFHNNQVYSSIMKSGRHSAYFKLYLWFLPSECHLNKCTLQFNNHLVQSVNKGSSIPVLSPLASAVSLLNWYIIIEHSGLRHQTSGQTDQTDRQIRQDQLHNYIALNPASQTPDRQIRQTDQTGSITQLHRIKPSLSDTRQTDRQTDRSDRINCTITSH